MKAVITGASGFVGRHLCALLRSRGGSVLTVDRHGPADVTGDLAGIPLRELRGDVLFHLAAFANPSASRGQDETVYRANAEITARLVREAPVRRLVIASTCAVYAPGTGLAEDAPLLPRTPYAASKLCSEGLALASGRDVVVLRPFNHTGPGQSEAYVCTALAKQAVRAESGLGPARIAAADLAPKRDFFDVRDMARAYLAAALRGRRGAVYNVCTGKPVSIEGICRILSSLSRRRLEIRGARRDGSVLSGDGSAFRKATGWIPAIPLRRTLADLLDHERGLLRP